MKQAEVRAAFWTALGRVASKEDRRAELTDGAVYNVHLSIAGKIGGQVVAETVEGPLTVGHSVVKASSSGADDNHLVALLLSKLPPRTAAALLKNLPEQFAVDGDLPDVDEALLEAAKGLRERLRVKREVTVKGAVAFFYKLLGALD